MENKVAIIDFTVGNLHSLKMAFQKMHIDPIITNKKREIENSQKIVLPGVGSFATGMEELNTADLEVTIQRETQKGKPLLGIWLGIQMLMSRSEEGGFHKGLDLIPGKVEKFYPLGEEDTFKVPHYGWAACFPLKGKRVPQKILGRRQSLNKLRRTLFSILFIPIL